VVRTATGAKGMVVAGHPLAAEAGRDALQAGGTAVDAAIAAAMVLNVVCPYATTLGGDVFALVYDAKSKRLHGLNGSGAAPDRATSFTQTGPASISVPGAAAGLFDLHAKLATVEWGTLLSPAIGYAAEGFPAHAQLIRNMQQRAEVIAADPECARLWGTPFKEGETVRQPELASVLTRLAAEGAEAFYLGDLAEALAVATPMSVEDLAGHASLWQEPMSLSFAGHEVVTCAPNSYGLTLLFQLMALAEDGVAKNDADFIVQGISARKRAYAAADGLIGDPAVCEDSARAALARGHLPPTTDGEEDKGGGTACVVALDAMGNAVCLIESISAPFGAGVVAPGTGVLFNNRMPGFTLKPGHPNVLAPGKRPAHTLSPCLVMKNGRPAIAIATPGTLGQTCILAQTIARLLACGMDIEEAMEAPRYSVALDGTPAVEAGMAEALKSAIQARVPKLKTVPNGFLTFGSLKIATVAADGFRGYADSRRVAQPVGL
jgi:gamma-glutamyltranspeptidase/glutathione hydrolase